MFVGGYIFVYLQKKKLKEMTTEELENYKPKGQLIGFPKEIIARMLDYQEEQGNPRDISVFEKQFDADQDDKGFTWNETKEKFNFWEQVIHVKNFNHFFEKYPKKTRISRIKNNENMQENNKKEEDSQEFRIGDKVIDILLYEIGVVQDIEYSSSIPYGLSVEFKSGLKSYTINGCYIPECKNPQILHYRDDYDYSIINFNNLPERQEPKRWRAEKWGEYYTLRFYIEDWFFTCATKDNDSSIDNTNYYLGNYFQTREEAQEVADKLNKYFQELINPNK